MSAAYAEILLDAHVHIHPCFSRREFFFAAARNLQRGRVELGVPHAAVGLMLTESAGVDAFAELRGRAHDRQSTIADDGWTVRETAESNSLWVIGEDPAAFEILVVAGRQLVTREGLEVLALGCAASETSGGNVSLHDGFDLEGARDAVIEAGGVPVIPWGFGKWWFSRGRVVASLLDQEPATPGRYFVGDNSGRPRLSRRPHLFEQAARRGIFVLPGSDPLPFPSQVAKPGRCGLRLPCHFDRDRPAAAILDALRGLEAAPETFGTYETLARFAANQLAMQVHKRAGRRRADTSPGAST